MKKLQKLIIIIVIALLLFYGILLLFGGNIAGILYQALFYGKYNTMFISEIVILLFALAMLGVRKRLSIVRFSKNKLIYGIKRGMPILIVSLISLFSSVTGLLGESINIPNLVSLILLSITIGMAEEFFFRGFIQEEIIAAYGNTRKQVIISIVISGVIFGLVHISNILSGQDLVTTLMQVLQASSLGILLGSVYYISNNIWSVVFLHSFYDAAILLGEVNSYKDCVNNSDISIIMLIFTLIVSLVYVIIYLIMAYLNLQKRHVNERTGEEVTEDVIKVDKENATRAKKLIVVVIVALFLASPLIPAEEVNNYQICYTYEKIDIKGEARYSLNDEFVISNEFVSMNLKVDNDKLVASNEDIELEDYIYDIYVYEVDGFYHIILNAGEKIYYKTINRDNINFEALTSDWQIYDVPEIVSIGALETEEGTFPFLKSYISDYFIIKDNQVMVIE